MDSNTTNSTMGDLYHLSQKFLYGLIFIVGLVGNTLVIYVIIRFSKMQTVTNRYIVNLAIADELFLIGLPFLMVTMHLKQWIFGEFMCITYLTITGINQFTSSMFLCIMSADRYVAVCHPISSPRWRTPFISKLVSFLAWIWSIILMIPIIIHSGHIENDDETFSCTMFPPNINNITNINNETVVDNTPLIAFTMYNFSLGFAAPLTLILVFYFLVIHKLRTVGPQNKSKVKKRSHRKVTKLVLTVVTVYVLCWLPYWIVQLLIIYTKSNNYYYFSITASSLAYSNSAVNPILYAFLSENFKKSFLKACKCAGDTDLLGGACMETSVFPTKRRSKMLSNGNRISLVPSTDGDLNTTLVTANSSKNCNETASSATKEDAL